MTTEKKSIKNKLGSIKLTTTLGSGSQACKLMRHPRDSFYRFKELYYKQRSHSGKYRFGKKPWQTFLDSNKLADEKLLDRLQLTEKTVSEVPSAR
jgi:hypothetical protein